MRAVKTKSVKHLLSSGSREDVSFLQYLNLERVACSLVFFIIASHLPEGKSEPDYKLALILGLAVYAAGIVSEFVLPKTNALFARRKAFFKSNQIVLVRSAAVAVLIALVFCFFQNRQIWIFGIALTGVSGLYFYLFSKILTGSEAGTIGKLARSLIFCAGSWCITWLGTDVPSESILAGSILLLIFFQNTLLRAHYVQYAGAGKGLTKGDSSGNLIRIITVIILMLGAAGCYFTTFRFAQRLFGILMLTSAFQYMLTLGKHSLYRKGYARALIEWVMILPFTIL